MKKKIIAAGHICLDITPVFPQKQKTERLLADVLTPGRLLHMEEADVHTGGSVANTGLAMKLLGADVSLMGKVGGDAFGNIILEMLRQYGAEKGMIVSEKESTSYSIVLAVPGIDRIFLHHPGTNDSFRTGDIPPKAVEEAALLHFGYPPLMKAMYEKDGEELVELMVWAKACGAATSLDFAAIDPDCAAGSADWMKILERVIPYVDFLLPSAEELCYMIDRERFMEWKKRADGRDVTEILDIENDIEPLAKKCMDMGAKTLVIKCGAAGMYYETADAETMRRTGEKAGLDADGWAKKKGFEKSYVPKRIASGTGAGDTSIAAFLVSMLEGCTLEECMKLAAATGACCVASYDALGGLKPLAALRTMIADGWKKNDCP